MRSDGGSIFLHGSLADVNAALAATQFRYIGDPGPGQRATVLLGVYTEERFEERRIQVDIDKPKLEAPYVNIVWQPIGTVAADHTKHYAMDTQREENFDLPCIQINAEPFPWNPNQAWNIRGHRRAAYGRSDDKGDLLCFF